MPIVWPDGKRFAFTITDDTDKAQLDKIRAVYDVLLENGFRITKTVWPLRANGRGITGGQTLEDEDYVRWVCSLRDQGIEIALHGAADGSSSREAVLRSFEVFRTVFQCDPRMHINHVGQREAVYWGSARLDSPFSWFYRAFRTPVPSEGHQPNSPYFWGDVCKDRIRYVRNMVWNDINTLKMDPLMPYHDPGRPYVNYWYSASHGSGIGRFCSLLSEKNQDRLAEEGGACIVYTHLGSSFYPVTGDFKRLLRRLASLPGWYVPASTVLDFLGQSRGLVNTAARRVPYLSMQARWACEQAASALRKRWSLRQTERLGPVAG